MSNVFGVPPPPRPTVMQPRPTPPGAPPAPAPPVRRGPLPDPNPGRNRLALVLAFLAGAMLVFANLATWLHQDGIGPAQAQVVADATYDDAVVLAAEPIRRSVTAAILALGSNDPTVVSSDLPTDANVIAQVDAAVRTAFDTPTARTAWQNAVAQALTQQQQVIEGGRLPDDVVVVTFDPTVIVPSLLQKINESPYNLSPGDIELERFTVRIQAPPGGVASALGTLADLWLLFWIGAIGLAAGSIAAATRRLRMAAIIALDAALMLVVCLLLVPLMRQVADERTTDDRYVPLINDAYDALTATLVSQTLVLIGVAAAAAVVLGYLSRRPRRGRKRAA